MVCARVGRRESGARSRLTSASFVCDDVCACGARSNTPRRATCAACGRFVLSFARPLARRGDVWSVDDIVLHIHPGELRVALVINQDPVRGAGAPRPPRAVRGRRHSPAQPVACRECPRYTGCGMAARGEKYMSERLRLRPCPPRRVETKRAEPRSTPRLHTSPPRPSDPHTLADVPRSANVRCNYGFATARGPR